jgi:hypothetical protein
MSIKNAEILATLPCICYFNEVICTICTAIKRIIEDIKQVYLKLLVSMLFHSSFFLTMPFFCNCIIFLCYMGVDEAAILLLPSNPFYRQAFLI